MTKLLAKNWRRRLQNPCIHTYRLAMKQRVLGFKSRNFTFYNVFFIICRRMFPAMRISFSNLDPKDSYVVLLDVTPLDSKRHRYSYGDSAWFVAGDADPPPPRKLFVHPESPFSGEHLMKQIVSFEKVKLTNNRTDKRNSVSTKC